MVVLMAGSCCTVHSTYKRLRSVWDRFGRPADMEQAPAPGSEPALGLFSPLALLG